MSGLILMCRKLCRNKAANKFKLLISNSIASSSFTLLLLNIKSGRTPTNILDKYYDPLIIDQLFKSSLVTGITQIMRRHL
jgi:hypothetical protein